MNADEKRDTFWLYPCSDKGTVVLLSGGSCFSAIACEVWADLEDYYNPGS